MRPPLSLTSCLVAAALLPACSCQRQPADEPQPSETTAPISQTTAMSAEASAPDRLSEEQRKQRSKRMLEAVDVLHSYLRELASDRVEAAQARWAYHRAPAEGEEAGLRKLTSLRSLRIQHGTPEPLDEEPVPQSLEIPVMLIASTEADGNQRFDGSYKLRYNPVETEWELFAVSLKQHR